MNFFEHQDQARRSTRRLVLLFLLAVVAVVAAVNAAALGILSFGSAKVADGALGGAGPWLPQAVAGVSLATLSVIGSGTLYKTAQLAGGGGEKVASLLGGRPVDPNTDKPAERRLLNVVEEMALAAGTPVPTVYLLDKEPGINAFAAGLDTDDAVIGITRGAMELLSRDELQGVVAHEFSHILNGDMRLNFRLICIVHGILVIGLIGYWMLRSARWSGGGGSSRERGAGAYWLLLGLAVYAIGYVGFFFGGLIKSAVSRQREFLADAAAVQFTRNPNGLAGALKKIGGLAAGSRLKSPNAEQASHLFFGQGAGRPLFAWMATHPPLAERIRRLDPSFDGVFPEVSAGRAAEPVEERRPEGRAADRLTEVLTGGPAGRVFVPEAVARSVGRPSPAQFAYAAALLEALDTELADAAREPAAARALVCALLIDRAPAARGRQLEQLAADPLLVSDLRRLLPMVDAFRPDVRLPLLELALPALRRLSPAQYAELKATVERLAEADRRLTLFEFTLHRQLLKHLEPAFHGVRPPREVHASLAGLASECSLLLSALAHAGAAEGAAAAAFAAGARHLVAHTGALSLLDSGACRLADVDRALTELAGVTPRLKAPLVEACAAALGFPGAAGDDKRELLRAVADALGCPIPPLLAAS